MTRDINQSWGSGVEDTSSPFLFSPLHGCSSDTVSLPTVSEFPVVTGMVGSGVGSGVGSVVSTIKIGTGGGVSTIEIVVGPHIDGADVGA